MRCCPSFASPCYLSLILLASESLGDPISGFPRRLFSNDFHPPSRLRHHHAVNLPHRESSYRQRDRVRNLAEGFGAAQMRQGADTLPLNSFDIYVNRPGTRPAIYESGTATGHRRPSMQSPRRSFTAPASMFGAPPVPPPATRPAVYELATHEQDGRSVRLPSEIPPRTPRATEMPTREQRSPVEM